MGPKPVAGEDQTGLSPDDRNFKTELVAVFYYHCIANTVQLKQYYSTTTPPERCNYTTINLVCSYSRCQWTKSFPYKHTQTLLCRIYKCTKFAFVGMPNGTIVASEPNPAVSEALLKEVLLWKIEGCTDDDVTIRLQQRTVPAGYKFHSWIAGK